jgi:hypothetical protein
MYKVSPFTAIASSVTKDFNARLMTTRISNSREDILTIQTGQQNTIKFPYYKQTAGSTWKKVMTLGNKLISGHLVRNCHQAENFPIAMVFRLENVSEQVSKLKL